MLSLFVTASAFSKIPLQSRNVLKSVRSNLHMAKKEGDIVPKTTFKCRVRDETIPGPNPFTWKDVTTDDLFKGKRVALFALPGGKLF